MISIPFFTALGKRHCEKADKQRRACGGLANARRTSGYGILRRTQTRGHAAGLAVGLQTRAAQAVMGFCGARRWGAPPGLQWDCKRAPHKRLWDFAAHADMRARRRAYGGIANACRASGYGILRRTQMGCAAGLAVGLQTRAAQAVMGFCGARRHAGAPPGLRRDCKRVPRKRLWDFAAHADTRARRRACGGEGARAG